MLVPLLWVSFALQEFAGSIRSVNLEAFVIAQNFTVWRMADGKAQIVQDSSHGMGLTVALLGLRQLVGDDEAEQHRPDNVIVRVVRGVLAGEFQRLGNQRSVRNMDTCQLLRRQRIGGPVELQLVVSLRRPSAS